jgi:hypothetical protein
MLRSRLYHDTRRPAETVEMVETEEMGRPVTLAAWAAQAEMALQAGSAASEGWSDITQVRYKEAIILRYR